LAGTNLEMNRASPLPLLICRSASGEKHINRIAQSCASLCRAEIANFCHIPAVRGHGSETSTHFRSRINYYQHGLDLISCGLWLQARYSYRTLMPPELLQVPRIGGFIFVGKCTLRPTDSNPGAPPESGPSLGVVPLFSSTSASHGRKLW